MFVIAFTLAHPGAWTAASILMPINPSWVRAWKKSTTHMVIRFCGPASGLQKCAVKELSSKRMGMFAHQDDDIMQ